MTSAAMASPWRPSAVSSTHRHASSTGGSTPGLAPAPSWV
jgi:hypothetical protein